MSIAFFGGCLESTLAARRYPRQAAGPLAGISAPVVALPGFQLTTTPAWAGDDRVLYAIDRARTITAQGIAAAYGQRGRRNEGTSALQTRVATACLRARQDPDRRSGTRAPTRCHDRMTFGGAARTATSGPGAGAITRLGCDADSHVGRPEPSWPNVSGPVSKRTRAIAGRLPVASSRCAGRPQAVGDSSGGQVRRDSSIGLISPTSLPSGSATIA
jgi:hypothetical protein